MNNIIEVQGLKKSYGDVAAVKGIDFYMEEGNLFAFLGVNGAGKSTTIDMITTFLKPDAGSVFVNGLALGKEDEKIREQIGAVFQKSMLDDVLSVKENLITRGSLYGLSGQALKDAVQKVIQLCELEEIEHRLYGKLSGGQRRRCDIARALIHTPKLLFLDEPTTGLDPKTRKMIWNVIQKLQKEEGMSVFLTTHYMEEAADADYVVVMNQGEITAKGTPTQLKERFAKDRIKLYSKQEDALCAHLQAHSYSYHKVQDAYEIYLTNTMEAITIITACQDKMDGFEVIHGTMDDAFLSIIGKEINE